MTLTRNPNYWQQGLPRLDGLEFRPLPDTESRYASVENGDVDLIFGGYHTELVRGMANPNLRVYYGPGHGAEWIIFNHTKAPFDDHRMREALVRGIDLNALAAVQFRNQMERATGYFSDSSAFQTPEAAAAWPAYDVERAKALVQEYVAGGGNATVVYKTTNAPNRVEFAEFLQAQLATVGITLQPQFYDLAQYSSSVVQSRDFQVAGNVGGPVDAPRTRRRRTRCARAAARTTAPTPTRSRRPARPRRPHHRRGRAHPALPAGAADHQPGPGDGLLQPRVPVDDRETRGQGHRPLPDTRHVLRDGMARPMTRLSRPRAARSPRR